jgi:hypothetical protein
MLHHRRKGKKSVDIRRKEKTRRGEKKNRVTSPLTSFPKHHQGSVPLDLPREDGKGGALRSDLSVHLVERCGDVEDAVV